MSRQSGDFAPVWTTVNAWPGKSAGWLMGVALGRGASPSWWRCRVNLRGSHKAMRGRFRDIHVTGHSPGI
ncbi:hypothetical protein [Microbulbifer epialgicus]|uniref:Uncharacterized protein n=1 Tax=Microbulbifer epialgicus TaxID=393907 RepID=A0ABV4NUC3_9GAMM